MPQSEIESASQSERARILVVEDEALIRFAIAEALRELGASVVEAASADEAWQYLTTGGRLGFHRSSDAWVYDGRSTRNPD
jgi:two-component system, response regulator PdtaR